MVNKVSLETSRVVSDVSISIKVDYFEMQNDICVFNRVIKIDRFDYCLQEQGICLKKELEQLSKSVLFKSRCQNLYLIHSCDIENIQNMKHIVHFLNYKNTKPFDTVNEALSNDFCIVKVYEDKIVDYETKKNIFTQNILDVSNLLTEEDKDIVISNMANYIDTLDIDEDICKKVGNECLMSEDLSEEQKKEICGKCIINFFKQK